MNLKRICLTIIATFGIFSLNVNAREFADIYTECGLGAMIAPNNEVVAAITNVTWDLGTTAISSNASSEDSCKGGKAQTAALLYETYPSLEREIAVGAGEHLDALVVSMACDSQPSAIATLRSELSRLVSEEGYSAKTRYENAEALYNAVTANMSSSAQSCTLG